MLRWFGCAPRSCSGLQPRGISSGGRAIGSQSIGQGFESPILHLFGTLLAAFLVAACQTTPAAPSPPIATENRTPLPSEATSQTGPPTREARSSNHATSRLVAAGVAARIGAEVGTTTTVRAPIDSRVEELLAAMSLSHRVGQRIVGWLTGPVAGDEARTLVQDLGVAGLILRADNIESSTQLRTLTGDLQKLSAGNDPPIALLIAIDQEGGRVARLKLPEATRLPPPAVWAAAYDADYVEALSYVVGRELRYHGANVNFAPVLDLKSGSPRSVVGDRAFSSDPAVVAELGVAYVRGASRAGVLLTGKHFPGHGATTIDSHFELPRVDHDREQMAAGLVPFAAAIDAGLPMIMTAHILFPRVDSSAPATFSGKIMRDMLRDELGFRGVLVSDAMEMRAVSDHNGLREIAERSLRAGVDIILLADRFDAAELHAEMMDLVSTGAVDHSLLDEGVRRILRLKLTNGLVAAGDEDG